MLLRPIAAVALVLGAANAYRDASPFFILSTDSLESDALHSAQVASSNDIQEGVMNVLGSDCRQQSHIIVTQPGITAKDLSDLNDTPYLSERVLSDRYKSLISVTDVLGHVDTQDISRRLASRCNAEEYSIDAFDRLKSVGGDSVSEIVTVHLPELSADATKRASQLRQNDAYLHALMSDIEDRSYTLIYTTTPPPFKHSMEYAEQSYEMDEPMSVLHTDLRRDLHAYPRANNSTDNPQSDLPLFEKYQFLNPGIFMGLSVSLLLFLILWVGVSAIANLEVSYMAFNKEMGPGAQKRQG